MRLGVIIWLGLPNEVWSEMTYYLPYLHPQTKHCIASQRLWIILIYQKMKKKPEILIAHKGQLPWTVIGCGGFCMSKLLLSVNPLRIWAQLGHHNLIVMLPCSFIASKKMQDLFKGRCFPMTFRVNLGDFSGIRNTTENLYNK